MPDWHNDVLYFLNKLHLIVISTKKTIEVNERKIMSNQLQDEEEKTNS